MQQTRKSRSWLFILCGFLAGALVGLVLLAQFGMFDLRSLIFSLPEDEDTLAALPDIGNPAPDFTLTDINGNQVNLSALSGKLVVLNFWATWCAPCRTEMPEFDRIYRNYQPELVVLGINFQEKPEDVREFITSMDVDYPILLDPEGQVARQYKVIQLPNTYFIDRQGTIRARHIGFLSSVKFQNYLDTLGVNE